VVRRSAVDTEGLCQQVHHCFPVAESHGHGMVSDAPQPWSGDSVLSSAY
jgi:hypothetical protein